MKVGQYTNMQGEQKKDRQKRGGKTSKSKNCRRDGEEGLNPGEEDANGRKNLYKWMFYTETRTGAKLLL